MFSDPLYLTVSDLKYAMQAERNTPTGIARRAAFADALERLAPPGAHIRNLAGLRAGGTYCGSAAVSAVQLGADKDLVLATARLLLT